MPISARFPALLLLAACALPMSAHAAGDYDNCAGFIDSLPASISSQGTWCLRKDLATSIATGDAITIKANNVTLDCNGFKIGGLSAGPGTTTDGVRAVDRMNITVRNCNIRGFHHGVAIFGPASSGHVVEDNRFEGCPHEGISLQGGGSIVQRNLVLRTGGSTSQPGFARAISINGSIDVLDNTISGVVPSMDAAGDALAIGVYSVANLSGSILGNRIRGLKSAGAGAAYGVYGSGSERISLLDNELVGTAGASTGLHCTDDRGRAKDNVISGFTSAISGCADDGNVLAP
ncbi:MAG: right-handed parallel beta-helix repeat-containing protein [Pseudomonadota bacterium]|nr:right-handed parallel beta-helix repeat-containing protein [Pseudomonadota bacterium]